LWLFVWPAWRLLAMTLYADSPRRYGPALWRLKGFFVPGLLRKSSLLRSARVRIELQLLSPPRPRPVRLDHPDPDDFKQAVGAWKKEHREWKGAIRRGTRALITSDDAAVIDVDTTSQLLDNDGI